MTTPRFRFSIYLSISIYLVYFTHPRVRLESTERARESAIGTHTDHIHMATCRQYTPADEAFDKLMAMCSLRQWVFQSPNTVLFFVPFVVLLVAAVIAVTLLDVARTFGQTAAVLLTSVLGSRYRRSYLRGACWRLLERLFEWLLGTSAVAQGSTVSAQRRRARQNMPRPNV